MCLVGTLQLLVIPPTSFDHGSVLPKACSNCRRSTQWSGRCASTSECFKQLKWAFKTARLSERHVAQTCQLVIAILHGNLKFTIDHSHDVDATVVCNVDALGIVARFLGIQTSALENMLSSDIISCSEAG